ncbi:MFS transporter, partial [Mesobacillus boroniphilus]|uniref:MFS transporter n=1 Tax=Mesobacillus boroniphilus TaxID=308892 RepID=UPI0004CF2387
MDPQSGSVQQNPGTEKIWSRDFLFIFLANFFIFLGFQMTLPTIPLFVEQLGGNDQLIGFVVGIFTFSALLVRPFAGRMLETRGRGFVYLIGLVIFVLSVGSFGFAVSIAFLFLMRIVQGVGWGFSTTASGTIATDWQHIHCLSHIRYNLDYLIYFYCEKNCEKLDLFHTGAVF